MNFGINLKIDQVMTMLAVPLSSAEAKDGWTVESKKAIKSYFEDLKEKLQSGDTLPPLNISRGLDHRGVVGGPILELAAQISNELRLRK